jgi:hypothetical protein
VGKDRQEIKKQINTYINEITRRQIVTSGLLT